MSWAAVIQQLRGLLPRFALPADNPAYFELDRMMHDFGGQAASGAALRLQASGLKPSPAEAKALRQTLAAAAECLAASEASMPTSVNALPAMAWVSAVCELFSTCFYLCIAGGMPDTLLEGFLPSARLLLRSGAAAQEFALRRGATAAELLFSTLAAQAWALDAWQHALLVHDTPADSATAAQSCAPPALLHEWWQRTLASLQALEPLSRKPGTPYASVLANLAVVLGRLFASPAFDAHCYQLLQDKQLCSGLLKLVLPAISAMAVGLQLPPDRRPAGCTWHAAVHMAVFVSATLGGLQLQPTWLAPDGGQRLVAAAAQLLQCCPLPAPPATALSALEAEETTLALILQLEDAALLQYPDILRMHQHMEPLAVALPRRQAQLLLAALPKICEALAAVAQSPGPILPHSARIVSAAATVCTLLAEGARPQADGARPAAAVDSVRDLPAWLRGATTVLRWLPLLAATAERTQHHQPASSLQAYLGKTASSVLFLVVHVCCSSLAGLERPDSGWAAGSRAVQSECLTLLWELHTAVCRAVHSVLAGAIPRQLVTSVLVDTMSLSRLIELPFLAASAMYTCKEGDAASLPPEATRCMPAMAVSYSETLLAILDACAQGGEELDADRAIQMLAAIAAALYWGPPALATDQRLQAAAARCLARVPQAALLGGCVDAQLFEAASHSPQAAVVLVAAGLPERLLQASPRNSTLQTILLPFAKRLLSTAAGVAQQPAAAEEPAAGAAAAAVAEAASGLERAMGGSSSAAPAQAAASWLPPLRALAAALLAWWRRPEAQPAAALELAQAAAARSCAYLRCANLGGEGGPAAGQGAGSQRCSACRAVWYWGTACSHADWRAGHRRVCKALGAARAAEKERWRQAAAAQAADEQGDI